MEKRQLVTCLMLFLLTQSYAGGWTCHLFKLKIETDAESIIGYVYFEDSFREYFKNNEITNYINTYHRTPPYDTIQVYDSIHSLNYPEVDGYKLTTTLKKNITKVPVNRIKTIRTISRGPCNEWLTTTDTTNYERYYRWVGHTMPHDQLTIQEIELLMTKPKVTISCPDPDSKYTTLYIMSYSENMPNERVTQMLDEFNHSITNYSGNEPTYVFAAKRYAELKNALRKENIIVIRLESVA